MSLLKGKTFVSRFYVEGFKGKTDLHLRTLLSGFIIRPLERDSDSLLSCGVCSVEGDPTLENQSLFCGEYSVFGYRVDSKKVDGGALRKAVKQEVNEWLSQHTEYKRCPKETKYAISEALKQQMVKNCFPTTKVYLVCVNMKTGMVHTDMPAGVTLDNFVSALELYEASTVKDAVQHYDSRRLEELGITQSEEPLDLPTFFTRCARKSLDNTLSYKNDELHLNLKVAFGSDTGASKTCTIAGDNIEASKEYQAALQTKQVVKMVLQKVGDSDFFVALDDKGNIQMNIPNSEAEEFDEKLVARMEHVEAVCEMVDRLIIQSCEVVEKPVIVTKPETMTMLSSGDRSVTLSFDTAQEAIATLNKATEVVKERRKPKKASFVID